MTRITAALLGLLLIGLAAPAGAQGYGNTTGYVISTCNSPPLAYTASTSSQPFAGPIAIDTGGRLCITGAVSLAGTTSNASSGVATSATNVPTVAYNYGFNGTTWDQIQVDGSKNLKVAVQGAVAANISTGATPGAAVPSMADYLGINIGGNLVGITGFSLGSQRVPGVAIVDASGAQITSFGVSWVNTNKIEPWDGTNTVTVKAASTAPLATDTGQVMLLRPDSPGIVALGQTIKSGSVPVTIASDQGSLGALSSQYPSGAIALTASTTGTTGATTATLAGVSLKTTYICGFTITSDATAALAGTATVTGTISGTMSFIQNVGGATAAGILTQSFVPCVPASATNTGIAINSVAAGTGGNTAVTAWGFQL